MKTRTADDRKGEPPSLTTTANWTVVWSGLYTTTLSVDIIPVTYM